MRMTMRRDLLKGCMLCLVLGMSFASDVGRAGATPKDPSHEVLILLPPGKVSLPEAADRGAVSLEVVRSARLRRVLDAYGISSIERPVPVSVRKSFANAGPSRGKRKQTDWSNFFRLVLPEAATRSECLDSLNASGEVIFAEANAVWMPAGSAVYPNDPLFKAGLQYGLWNYGQGGNPNADIRGPELWSVTTGSASQKIAILDYEGVDHNHEDISGKISQNEWDTFVGPHGVYVAGVAAATSNNAKGIAGVNWGARIYPRYVQTSDVMVSAIGQALGANCGILNFSGTFEQGENPISVRLAAADAYNANAVCVAAMGNAGNSIPLAPARYQQGMIAVGATNSQDFRWPQSNTGGHIDVCAPGFNISVCGPGTTQYSTSSSTSFAAAHVSGLASLLRGYNTNLDTDDVQALLQLTADPVGGQGGWNTEYGAGRVNGRTALDYLSYPSRLIHGASTSPGGTVVGSQYLPAMQFYGVAGLQDGGNYEAVRLDVQKTFTFPQTYPNSITPIAWGRGRNATGFSNETPNIGLGWCDVVWAETDQSHFVMRTYVYKIYIPGGPFLGYWPCAPSQVWYEYTLLELHRAADPVQSYFAPEKGPVEAPIVGSDALDMFRMCPNNDLASLPNNARIKLVLKDSSGNPVVGVPASDIYMQFNGGTAAQGFVGEGADSIIANSTWNSSHGCPTVFSIPADESTNVDGVTYITFKGSTPGSPGIATRNPGRKWGHYDFELPVFVRGERMAGRLTEADLNGSYILRIKNIDWAGGLGTASGGETVDATDFNGVANTLHQSGPVSYWKDFDSNGDVGSTDFNLVNNHVGHDCDSPNNP